MGLETFVDWFAGIGGFRLGLEPLGLRCVGACENDRFCREVYNEQFGHEPEYGDTRKIDPRDVPDHDLFTAGFPCQAFSLAGKRQGFRDTRGTVFFEICRILKFKRPPYLLLENVPGILTAPSTDEDGKAIPGTRGWVFLKVLESLGELGYSLQWQVCNSRHFGVPQNRSRVYIVGNSGEVPQPEVFPLSPETSAMEKDTPWRSNPLGKLHSHQGGRVYGSGNISPTLDTGKGPLIDTGMGLRLATPLERERIQGFPDNWTSRVSDAQRYKQTGNAATPAVIRAIGQKLLDEVNNEN